MPSEKGRRSVDNAGNWLDAFARDIHAPTVEEANKDGYYTVEQLALRAGLSSRAAQNRLTAGSAGYKFDRIKIRNKSGKLGYAYRPKKAVD